MSFNEIDAHQILAAFQHRYNSGGFNFEVQWWATQIMWIGCEASEPF